MRIASIGHVALSVRDLEETLSFYRDKLGFAEMFRKFNKQIENWIIYLRITDTQFLELFPDGEGERAPKHAHLGVTHICLTVEDLDAAVADITAKGVELWSPINRGEDGNRQAWIRDPNGIRIELMEMNPACTQFEAVRRLERAAEHAG